MERILKFTAGAEHSGMSINAVLRQHFNMSSSIIKQLKSAGGITVNNEPHRVSYIMSCGDELRLVLREGRSELIEPVKIDFGIVFEDEDIIVINKPAGIATHPSHGHFTDTLANGLMYYFAQKNEEHVFRAVNRLDKDTSGLMCAAKNSYAHSRLCTELHNSFERRYTAILEGQLEHPLTIDAPIARCEEGIIKRCVSEEGKRAVTHCTPLKIYNEYTLAELSLETGRTHQIRVHMSHAGFPLLGDWLYGHEDKALFPRTALHSSHMEFTHPVTGTALKFDAPLPDDMKLFLQKL